MKELKQGFKRNGPQCTLIKRNGCVALYRLSGTYTEKGINYEVCVIYIRNDQYGEREAIATNDDFGRDRSRAFNNEEKALKYYDELTAKLIQPFARNSQDLLKQVVRVWIFPGKSQKIQSIPE